MARVLIVGGGYIGKPLAYALAKEGNRVFVIRRSDDLYDHGNISLIKGDIFDLKELPQVDAVIYLISADARSETCYQSAYIDGPDRIWELCKNNPPKRFMFASSTAVYPFNDGSWVDEATILPKATEMNGKCLQEAEKQIFTFQCDQVITRIGGIYGPNRYYVIDMIKKGRLHMTEHPTYTNRIHQTDCVRALHHLFDLPDVMPVYNLVDSSPTTVNELLSWLSTSLGIYSPIPSQAEEYFKSKSNKQVSNVRLLETFFEFKYPSFREGYEPLLEAK
ncbi:MAG: NAD-dependent epimerase/dehydratase family protein [Gammaproteobacteria bacterium]|nr:NAD-dependent epimerase/dehydratase family protein [Gammaproteobacteria bacterium]